MTFALACAGLLLYGNANTLDVSGNSFYNYMRPGHITLSLDRGRTYADGGQYEITIARDHKRVWVQLDADDNPHDRGDELRCRNLRRQL